MKTITTNLIVLCLFCMAIAGCKEKEYDLVQIPEAPIASVKPYKLCEQDAAEFSLQIDFEIKGIGTQKKVYHFPHRFTDSDFFISESLKSTPFGPDGNNILSCGLSRIGEDGVQFLVTCTNTTGENRREVIRNINIPYEKTINIDNTELKFSAKWIDRKSK